MRKKIISMLLASMMILSMALTGCGNNESGTADTVDGTQTTSAAAEGDLTDIKMAYMIFNTAAPDMGLVQDEINKISEKEIGVHVTIEPIAVGDYATQVNLMFASGEELDIVQALTTNFTAWYANGSLTPIDSELETYGQGIIDAVGRNMLEAGKIDGKQYGITTNRDLAKGYGFAFRTDLLDKYGIDASSMKTLDDIEAALAIIKEKEPDIIPLTFSWILWEILWAF